MTAPKGKKIIQFTPNADFDIVFLDMARDQEGAQVEPCLGFALVEYIPPGSTTGTPVQEVLPAYLHIAGDTPVELVSDEQSYLIKRKDQRLDEFFQRHLAYWKEDYEAAYPEGVWGIHPPADPKDPNP